MSFFDDIKYRTCFGKSLSYSLIDFGGEAIYIEGIKKLVSVSESKIVLLLRKKQIVIEGKKLVINDYESDCIVINGAVESIREVTLDNFD